ncbi:MAG: DivIVA domain-containing protein [Oscillospiraceae bacterium]|jgi:cell division initiation protein|nr:DivIVA domain-containing protein [Oscillospiraceae bacterium]
MSISSKIRDARFSKAVFGGYKSEDVDKFLDEIQDDFQKFSLCQEELKSENERLKRKIEQFKAEESVIKRAIINSQQIADASLIDAGVKSKYILKDASEKAEQMVRIAKENADKKLEIAKKLQENTVRFKKDLIKCYQEQVEALRGLSEESVAEIEKELFKLDETTEKFSGGGEQKFMDIESRAVKDDLRARFLSELAVKNGLNKTKEIPI